MAAKTHSHLLSMRPGSSWGSCSKVCATTSQTPDTPAILPISYSAKLNRTHKALLDITEPSRHGLWCCRHAGIRGGARSAPAQESETVTSDFIDDAKKAASDAWESAKKTAKEVLDHAAEKIIGPVRNNNEKDQLNQLEKQNTKSMPAPDGATPDRTSDPVAPHNGPSGLADPPDEFGKPEADVAKFASKVAAGLMSKVNPNPNDEGKPVQGEPIALPTPGVVDPPDDPMGSRTPAPKPKTGPRPGIGPLPRMS